MPRNSRRGPTFAQILRQLSRVGVHPGRSILQERNLKLSVLFVLFCVLWTIIQGNRIKYENWSRVEQWLQRRDLTSYRGHFEKAGIGSQMDVAQMENSVIKSWHLSTEDLTRVVREITLLRDQLILHEWLTDKGLKGYLTKFEEAGIMSLEAFSRMDQNDLTKVTAADMTFRGYYKVQELAHQVAKKTGYALNALKLEYWDKLLEKKLNNPDGVGKFSMILFSTTMSFLVSFAINNHPLVSRRNLRFQMTRQAVYEYVTGSYLAMNLTKVDWDWTEPQAVGKTMTFFVKFYQRNRRPHPICDRDNILIEIMTGTNKVLPHLQFGGDGDGEAHVIKVTFNVRRAGPYRISVMVNSTHVNGSPFSKEFLPGPLDPSKSQFVGQSTIVVCTKNEEHMLQLEPKDQYGNVCTHSLQGAEQDSYQLQFSPVENHAILCPSLNVAFERVSQRILITFTVPKEGAYTVQAKYKGDILKNGEFTVLVLSEKEAAALAKNSTKGRYSIYYEARLLNPSSKNEKAKKVYCYISPKQITLKEFYLKIIPKRLFTFRVCPSTKIQMLDQHPQYEMPMLSIDDGSQAPIQLASKDTNVIAATFAAFLLKNIGESETFSEKVSFFYDEIRRYHHRRQHDKIKLFIHRENILESSMKATKTFSTSDWCRKFEVIFSGEEGLDWGGVRREWFEALCTEMFEPAKSSLFRRFKDDPQGLVSPNPKRPSHLKLKHYEFAGKVVGKCMYESALGSSYRQMVKARFTRSFLAQLIGLRVNYRYFEQDDPDLFTSKIKYILENSMEGMELTFAEEQYSAGGQLQEVVELIPGGAKQEVTDTNKHRYLDSLAQYRLANSVHDEIEAFLKGLNDLVPDNLLSIFDENELELLMCGTGSYSIAEFKDNCIIGGSTPEFHRVLGWFWTIVSSFTQEEIARLLQFTTGCSQLPPGGFSELNPHFQITASPAYGNLPTAHTCFNQLCLPDYDSMEHLHQALMVAINEGAQGFGLV